MADAFEQIPEVVIDYVRRVFADANDKVTRTMSVHPSMHEESLDHVLIMELSATPPAFFAAERAAVSLESHWLGGRHMYHRWEIADIAFVVIMRRAGHLETRKVALLQTKRLYSEEIAVAPVDSFDYAIGIGRLVDRTDPQLPLTVQRRFRFNDQSVYGALTTGSDQVGRINEYEQESGIPVYYGLYNPLTVPFEADYPASGGLVAADSNTVGMRVLSARSVHTSLTSLSAGNVPTFDGLAVSQGWRIEAFVADEVLRCREGRRFDAVDDVRLGNLLYRRTAPIAAAITLTIDVGSA